MLRRTSIILSIILLAGALSLAGCQQNPADSVSDNQTPQQKAAAEMAKYDATLPAENKLALAQELSFKNQDQSMSLVTKMFPDLEKANVVEKDDAKNIMNHGQEAWYYSKDLDKTFVASGENYSLLVIFNGREMTDQDVAAAKSLGEQMKGGKEAKLLPIAEERAAMASQQK